MGSASSIIIGMLSLAAAAFGFAWTKSYLVSILIAVTAMLVCKSLMPFMQLLWDKFRQRFFPLPEVAAFYEKNLEDWDGSESPAHALGIRVLAMTEELRLNSKTRTAYLDMVQESLDALAQAHPIFQRRLEVVQRRDMPAQYTWALCGKDGKNMRKCLKAWFKTGAVREMRARTQNRDLFLHDGEIQIHGRSEAIRYTVLVLFDGSLPVTLPEHSEEAGTSGSDANP